MTLRRAGTELVAFVDESKKPARDLAGKALPQSWYAMAAVIVLAGQADEFRAHLADLSRDFRPRLHYKELSPSARRDALSRIAGLYDWDAVVVEIERPVQVRQETTVRRAVLATLYRTLANEHDVTSVVIESRSRVGTSSTLDFDDAWLAAELTRHNKLPDGLEVTHSRKAEQMLWLPDLVVGARTDAVSRADWRPWSEVSGRVHVERVQPRWRP